MDIEYNGLRFDTPLTAMWAAFFDLAGWTWHCNPVSIENWRPDFRLTFECSHSECGGEHTLFATVLPFVSIEEFSKHPCMNCAYGLLECEDGRQISVPADGGAAFGLNPAVTQWEIAHGAGGGVEDAYFRVHNADELWEKAIALVRATAIHE